MKKIIYLLTIALVTIIISCDKEKLITPTEGNTISLQESKNLAVIPSKGNSSLPNIGQNSINQLTNSGIIGPNGVPANVDALALYLDMGLIQKNYSGTYIGSFSAHYRNEMSAHFTIYSVQNALPSCGNIERWIVNKREYEAYAGTTIDPGIIVIDLDEGNDNTTSAGSTSTTTTGWGDANGNVHSTPPNRPSKPDDTPTRRTIPLPSRYHTCF